ncbi:MAG TPA: hypothetical protein VHC69_17120 [Polyangiaceae bacterium]|nr:hypothetical protein [Polyangiaceae bacterium]
MRARGLAVRTSIAIALCATGWARAEGVSARLEWRRICFDKRTLPASCNGSTSTCSVPECPGGDAPCGGGCLAPCAPGLSCITGCCIQPPA